MRLLAFIALAVSACHGSCTARSAAYEQVPIGALCAGGADCVLCVDGAKKVVWYCAIDGAFTYDAKCVPMWTRAEVTP